VYGAANVTTGTNYGVYGTATGGYGVYGTSAAAPPYAAVDGTNSGSGGIAVLGSATGGGQTWGVEGYNTSTSGTGVYGVATATTGATYGVLGEAASPTGYGVYARAPAYPMRASSTAATGVTYGFVGTMSSPQGIAAVFNNNAGGQLASFRNSGAEKASVDGEGDLVSRGNVTAGQLVSTAATGTAPLTVVSTTQVANLNASLLGGVASSGFATLGANTFTAPQTITVATGTAPLTVTSTTLVPNLDAGWLGGQPASAYPRLSTANSFTSTQLISASNSGALLESINGGASGKGSGMYAVLGAPSVEGTKSKIPVERGLWADTNASSVTASALLATADMAGAGGFYNDSTNVTLYAENDYPLASGSANVLYTTGPSGDFCAISTGANLSCTGTITGSTIAGGSITAPATTSDNRTLETYCVQSTENWYEDFGAGRLADGVATVALDGDFAQIVNTGVEYYVFLTPKGDSPGLYVSNQTASSFEVHESKGGRANIAFDYRIVAKRRGKESLRMRDITAEAGSNKTKAGPGSVVPQ
jgi:hypothetical protein